MTAATRQQKWDVTGDLQWENFGSLRTQMVLSGKRCIIQLVPEKRSLDQNSMIYALYQQIASQKEDESIVDIRRHCKAYFGVPILLAKDPEFAALYRKGIMPHLTPEEKLRAMDILPVTRRFSKEMATEYIDTIIREYSKQGISIVMPGEE